ncbi:MAG: hypothetical protein ACI85N_000763 [Gammaproteobacteria bacterium]|jgi:hypothetical protein
MIFVQKSSTIKVIFLVHALLISPTTIANKSDGFMLEKVYKLDSVKSSGVCPSDLKRVLHATKENFGCDRARIDFGYRSKELVQCKLRKNLANKIIHEYNVFIEQCKIEKQ